MNTNDFLAVIGIIACITYDNYCCVTLNVMCYQIVAVDQ